MSLSTSLWNTPIVFTQPVSTATKCACCGSMVDIRKPLVDLDSNRVSWGDKSVQLQGREADILATLVRYCPGVALYDRIYQAVWPSGTEIDEAANLKVQIVRLRRKLAPLGIVVKNVWGEGYRLVIE